MESETLQFARYYLSLGLHPIPVQPRGKVPVGAWKKWQTEQPSEKDILKWFGNGGNYNIGLVLGRGMIAVDFDGPEAEQLLIDSGVNIPADAPRSETSHGFHVLLGVSEPIGDRVALLATEEMEPGTLKPLSQVDIRGVGFIVAPPSIHPSGHIYQWVQRPGQALPAAPAALIALIKANLKAPTGATTAPGAPKWVSEALLGVGEGKRDATAARLAGYFLKKAIPPDIVKSTLYAFAERCTPPFSRSDINKTVDSVLRKDEAAKVAAPINAARNFQILGHDHGAHYYLPRGSQQVVELRADQHTKLHLLRLAPLDYWEREYSGKAGVQWDLAANALIRHAEAAGVYDTARIRGRGAWWDEDRAVLHLGDSVISENCRTPIMDMPHGKYIYEAAPPMAINIDDPLSADEANQLVRIAEMISWEKPISARLFAGFAALAPICGALTWRPHAWLTGGAGSGKSWCIENILRPLIGGLGLAVQSETTEAGLRQTLGHDARPVIFDEAEGEDQRAQMRIQNVLALMRQASSETGSTIIKGSPLGTAKTYRIRSCFVLSSIGVGLQQYADSTRVSVLSIERDGDQERFARLKKLTAETITESYAERFLARSIRMVPVIRANARTFAQAGASAIGSQRLGDQIGALLAGCYSLFSDEEISLADARAFIESQDWTEQKAVQEETDEAKCLQRILVHLVRVQTKTFLGERSVAELVQLAAGRLAGGTLLPTDAEEALGRVGVRVDRHGGDHDTLTVSSSHPGIAAILAGTAWRGNWARTLRRLRGAAATLDPVRFGQTRGRGVEIPLDLLE